jgi:hypothetical protein
MIRSKLVMTATLGAWLAAIVVYACVYVSVHINSSHAVGYEREWDWQLMFFALTRLPLLLGALGIILLIERRLFR